MSDVEMKEAHEVGTPEEEVKEASNDDKSENELSDKNEASEKNDKSESEKSDNEGEKADDLDDAELKDVDKEVIEDGKAEEEPEEEKESRKRKAEEDGDEYKDPVPPPPPAMQRKDKSLKEFLNSMDDYAPIIPDAVTDYYLAKSGFDTSDRRIKRLLALATQKFVSDIASDAYQYSRIRSSSSVASSSNPQARARALVAGMAGASAQAPSGQGAPSGGGAAQGRIVLTMEDLGNALAEYGLNIKRPDFYR